MCYKKSIMAGLSDIVYKIIDNLKITMSFQRFMLIPISNFNNHPFPVVVINVANICYASKKNVFFEVMQ